MEQVPKIVQRRLQGTPKPGVHPDPDLLTAFVEKSLNDRERSQVLQHLADCADCRDVTALGTPEIDSTPSPGAERSRGLSWPVLRWPTLRWGALAACVVVVSAAVTLHYEGRQTGETSVAKNTPAAPVGLTAENNVPQQPREKLAANIPPPAPFQSDRNSGAAAGKLAKQSEKSMDAPAPPEFDRDKKDLALSNNRLADTISVKAANKPASAVAVVGEAAPVPMPAAKEAPAAEARNDAGVSIPRTMNETVTVESAATSTLETSRTPEREAKDESAKNESQKQKEVQSARAGAAAATMGERKTDSLSTAVEQAASGNYAKRSKASRNAPRWTLSADGLLQRSFDSGKTWQTIPVANDVVFRALSANDSDIWVGGAAGALYHSSDAGQHWLHVIPVADGKPLTADIVTVEFSDAQHGTLATGNHETLTTSDAGDTWQKH
jgi:hypothetical protein